MFKDRDIGKLIIPLMIEQVLTILVGLIDSMMISCCGEAAVSGVSLVDTVNILMINVFTALTMGGAVVSGQLLGKKSYDEAKHSASQVVVFTAFTAFVIMVLLYGIKDFILDTVFSIDKDVRNYANIYILIVTAAIPFIGIYNACASLFRAQGDSEISMRVSLIMNGINIAGNALCIYGLNMGVAGAAIPTLISRIIAAVIMVVKLSDKKLALCLPYPFKFKPDFPMLKKILRIGVPNGIENSMFQLGKLVIVSMLTGFGTAHITANAVSNTITNFQIIPGLSIGAALLTIVSHCVGAGDYKQVHYYVVKLHKLYYIITFLICLITVLLLPAITKGYNLSAETTELTNKIVIYHSICCCIFWCFSFLLPNALRAANDVIYPMVLSLFSMWVFRVGASIVLAKWFSLGAYGAWIAMTIDWLVRSVLFIPRYRHIILKKIKKECF